MLKTKLLKFANTSQKILMSTGSENVISQKKLDHYKNLNALENSDVMPEGWDKAKPFESLPGPKPIPFFGNIWRFLVPKIGDFYGIDFLDLHKIFYEQYGDISILKGMINDPIVVIFNPKDYETLFRNEGIWPIRKGLQSFNEYRKSRKDIFVNAGLLLEEGENWFKIRSVVNPILMQPRNISQYTDKMNSVADELVNNITNLLEESENGEMPENFHNELYKWSLESVGLVTLDTHLGCLKNDLDEDSEPQKLIRSTLEMFKLMHKLDVLPSFHNYVSTPSWRKFVQVMDFIVETNMKYVNQVLDKLEKGETTSTEIPSVLEKLLKVDRNIAVTMSIDMMIAGIDTTGRILGAALYFLGKNHEAQEKLRSEAISLLQTKDQAVTSEVLKKAPYLKAVIKETTRLAPIGIGNLRTTVKNLVLGGYQIPKGTDVVTSNLVLCTNDEYFSRAKEFIPERWLSTTSGELSKKNTNPFIFAPFGYGPRSCVGKRLASLELEVALLKIIRNFELDWPHEDMVFKTKMLYGMTEPLKIHVRSV
ncbi:probable cytochrome P450 12c1, mitochondrial [Tribolium castaneum]|uniref:Cytochrome P450 12H1 n=1 Tax=Tribolium castaneum TaxID=7070 RepID=D6WP99_TRICA|nr:PREDICTED: probable cytochrome P450 12c1, mitochondrial [Tribolium castaneum]XP_008199960.1 PREDICTED: probable cytochrome P450 12c1, mitochondrial [Tribolium castaneum]XP_015837565.1 PREDICTED: probable cytochrome P450 12c1, mitochondrial [Tribolium castaneum]EFA07581.1 cytochrome P450 12H1 [Tribolium castaneum]|eukprot:XP_008199959.1 PREDICTED: probable cytochrome P450 12c1, mitochondrial [Tribolium castaneum]